MIEKKIYIFNKARSVRTWGYIADIIIMLLNIVQYGKSLTYNVSGTNHKSFYEVTKIISKIFNNMPIKIRNKQMNFVNPKTTILKISSEKYFKEFKREKHLSLINGLKKTIQWNKEWQKLS